MRSRVPAEPQRLERGETALQGESEPRRLSPWVDPDAARFEALVCELSARFVALPASRVDEEIIRSLQQIVEFLDVDRSTLGEFTVDLAGIRATHAFVREGYPPLPNWIWHEQIPWYVDSLRRGETLAYSDLPGGLPPEAENERAYCLASGMRANLTIPLTVGGIILGILAVGAFRAPRAWPEQLVQRLRLLGEIFANALARKRADADIQELLRFEELVGDVSFSLVNAEAGSVEQAIDTALGALGRCLGIDRVTLWERLESEDLFRATHSWSIPGVQPVPRVATSERFPWLIARAAGGEVVGFQQPGELPPEAEPERQYFREHDVRSYLMIPLAVGGEFKASLSLNSIRAERSWPERLVSRLELLGQILAGTLARQRAEEDAHRSREELAHVARVSALGELAASLAHELNQPLSAIVIDSQAMQRLLRGEQPDLAEVREALADIASAGNRASEIIARVRTLLRKGAVQYLRLDVNSVTQEVAELLRRDLVTRRAVVTLELATGLPRVLADRVQLQQVLLNLLLNGAEAIDARGGEQRRLEVRTTLTDDAAVLVSVEDNGIGLPPDPERVFAPFYTTKESGLGMGLSVCRSIVAAHGGRLWASAAAGGGAIFRFSLPAAAQDAS